MFIRVKANNEQVLLKKGNYKITGRMIDMGKDSCTYMVHVDRSKSKNDSKDIIFEVAKIAKNNIWEVYDERIVLSFETRYKFQRKRKLERLQMIYDYLRNCRQAVSHKKERGKKMEKNVFVLYKDTQKNICLTSSNEKASKEIASYIASKSIESPCYGIYYNGYTGRKEVIFSRNPYEGFMEFDDAVSIIENDDNFKVIKQGYVNCEVYMKDYITFEA